MSNKGRFNTGVLEFMLTGCLRKRDDRNEYWFRNALENPNVQVRRITSSLYLVDGRVVFEFYGEITPIPARWVQGVNKDHYIIQPSDCDNGRVSKKDARRFLLKWGKVCPEF